MTLRSLDNRDHPIGHAMQYRVGHSRTVSQSAGRFMVQWQALASAPAGKMGKTAAGFSKKLRLLLICASGDGATIF